MSLANWARSPGRPPGSQARSVDDIIAGGSSPPDKASRRFDLTPTIMAPVRGVLVVVAGVAAAALLAGCSSGPSAAPVGSPSDVTIDWQNTTVPGAVCGLPGSITLHQGTAVIQTNAFPGAPQVHVTVGGQTIYGPLEGTGSNDAGISVTCSNSGGTADGVLASGWAIFGVNGDRAHALGVISAQRAPTKGLPVPYVSQIAISPGTVAAQESWYRPGDPTCCPSGSSTTVWRYHGGKLVTP